MMYKDAIPVEWLENWSCRVNDYTEALLFRECKMRILEDWKKSRSISTDETGSENYTVTTVKGKMIPIKLERRDGLVRVVRCKDCALWSDADSEHLVGCCTEGDGEKITFRNEWCCWAKRREENESY